jgi:hypothetical protein
MLPVTRPSPTTEPEQGPPRYIEVDRKQVVLLPRDWEGLVGPDHLARAIWSLMMQLDWSEYEKRIVLVAATVGERVDLRA